MMPNGTQSRASVLAGDILERLNAVAYITFHWNRGGSYLTAIRTYATHGSGSDSRYE